MDRTVEAKNKALVLEAFDTLFNKRDYAADEKFWSPHYIQHSAHIAPGREGLFDLIKSLPATLKYEPGTIVAEGNVVIVHGRFSNFGLPVNWIAADILRIKDGILVEHWDVIQDEATKQESKSGLPMFGEGFSIVNDPTLRRHELAQRLSCSRSGPSSRSLPSSSAGDGLETVQPVALLKDAILLAGGAVHGDQPGVG